jgi:serine/threonine-protein kinase
MQFVDGLDLRAVFDQAVRRGIRIELGFLLHVFQRVCEGLEYAHRLRDARGRPLGVVHRDVSPQNVLVGFDGDVKLIDFGIAKASERLTRTVIGTIKGKYGYMSPEQVRGLPVDHRSDLFSLGICMHELLTRKRLFHAAHEVIVMEMIKDARVKPPRQIDPKIPVALERIVMRALAADASARYPSAADVYADLQAFAFSEGVEWSKPRIAEYMQRTFDRGAAKPSGVSVPPGPPPSARSAIPGQRRSSVARATDAVRVQEQVMSENKGSDLDVFEGLTSKRNASRPATASVPPPPPSRSVPPPPPRSRAATQMGLGLPPMPGALPRTSTPPIAPPPSRVNTGAPPPPPPPSRVNSAPLPPPPAPIAAAPPPAAAPVPAVPPPAPPPSAQARGAMVDMDWDDEDEKTHIYDKDVSKDVRDQVASARPTNGSAATPLPAPLPPPPANPKATMVGLGAALPPPPSRAVSDRPPPPPPPSRAPRSDAPAGASAAPAALPEVPFAAAAAPSTPAPAAPSVRPANASQPAPALQRAEATQVIRPKGGSTGLVIGALAVAAIAGVGGFVWMSGRPGNLLVNVDVKGAAGVPLKVLVDGTEKCSDVPCRVENLAAGQHGVKVVAGESATTATVEIQAGKDTRADLVLEVAAKKTGLKLSSTQTGLKVEIDGGSPRALPVDEDSLKPGKHVLKFTGPGTRYGTKELEVVLEEGQIKSIDDIKVPLKSIKAKFAIPTKGARVLLDDGTGKKVELKDETTHELETGKSYTVTASAPGFEDYSQKIELGDEPEMTVKVELAEKGKPAGGPIAAAPAPVPAVPVTAPAAAPPAPATGGDGSLFVNTLPPSACVVDGTPRGRTPFTIKISPGSHSITCVAKDGDETLKKSSTTQVKSGETAKVILKLRD